jgi:hypothetical protein
VGARAALFLLAALACGGRDAEAPPGRPPPAAVATRAEAGGRVQVALVNGEPVFADCVAAQMAADGIDARAALDRCIDFEVLAQEAVRRGLLADPDVLAARRNEMVRALVEAEFAPTLDEPTDVPAADLRWLWDTQLARRYNRPELRRATYCRVPLDKAATPGSPGDAQARKLAEALHAALGRMRGLEPGTFAALCAMSAGGQPVNTTAVPTSPFSREGRHAAGFYAPSFVDAAFAIAAPGQISPPTRTSWGWDILLLTDLAPAENRTLAQAEPEIREMLLDRPETAEYRRRKFDAWIQRYISAARIRLYLDNLADEAVARGARP